jgi:hypothetical protein
MWGHAIYGYSGDGSITAADITDTTGKTPVLFTPTTFDTRESWDVTSVMGYGMVTTGWAGFAVMTGPGGGMTSFWDCPDDELYPILTIEYVVDPPPSPPPLALPNTTLATDGSATPWNVLLLGAALVVAVCSWVAVSSHARVQRGCGRAAGRRR